MPHNQTNPTSKSFLQCEITYLSSVGSISWKYLTPKRPHDAKTEPFFSRWTNIIFSNKFLFQPTRMIELDGRSLMNRKKEAALLDMVEKYFLLQRCSRYNDSEDTVVITDWPGCIRNQIPTMSPTYICNHEPYIHL